MLVQPITTSSSLSRQVSGDGPDDARLVILTDRPDWADPASGKPLMGSGGDLLWRELRRAGVLRHSTRVEAMCERLPPGRHLHLLDRVELDQWRADCLERLKQVVGSCQLLVTLGEEPLQLVTGQRGISKWHLSFLQNDWLRPGRPLRVLPLQHPDYYLRQYREVPFLTVGANRVADELRAPHVPVQRELKIRPTLLEALAFIDACRNSPETSIDIETRMRQIVCIGLAHSPRVGMCIPFLPEDWSAADYHQLSLAVAGLLADNRLLKVWQNGVYDTAYFWRYGMPVSGPFYDCMHANKFLYSELTMGLDTLARMWTTQPYWKDDAKDWAARQNIDDLYRYNCLDACVPLEIKAAQQLDMQKRGLVESYEALCASMIEPCMEMSFNGITVDPAARAPLVAEVAAKTNTQLALLTAESTRLLGREINPRSHKQVKELLVAAGMRLPMKKGEATSDVKALTKLRLKYPGQACLSPLIELSALQKLQSSYLQFEYDADSRVRYSLTNWATETGRFSCKTDPFYRGLNAQTVPEEVKAQFVAAPDWVLMEIDLQQADARVVAWDSADPELIGLYQRGEDIHRVVASALFDKLPEQITKGERQLGKKSGHAFNYGVGDQTFAEACLVEEGLVISAGRVAALRQKYFGRFHGILAWQRWIEQEIRTRKRLDSPFGWHRLFFDRIGPDCFREAYAFRPQHVVAMVINHLIRHLRRERDANAWPLRLLLQIHDSALVEVHQSMLEPVLAACRDLGAWNPQVPLRGGLLQIPIGVKIGTRWSNMSEPTPGALQ